MNILVIYQQFLRPDEGGHSRFNEFSRYWSEAGHQVTVIAGQTSYLTGKRAPEYRRRWVRREAQGPVTVLRAYTPEANMTSFLSRLWNFVCFMLSATWCAVFVAPRPEVIIASSPQLTVAVPGGIGAAFRRCPFVFEVRDLWPESGIAIGGIREGSRLAKILYALEGWAYRRASAINVLTPAFKDNILARGLATPEKIWFIPSGADFSLLSSAPSREEARERLGWQGKFAVLYAGAHGPANDLMQLVETAEALRQESDILIVTAGSGAEFEMLSEAVERRELTNIRLLGTIPKQQMPELHAAADVGAAILKKRDTFKTVYPNKIFDYMSARLPVLLTIDGIARQLVEDGGAGVYVEAGDIEGLSRAILWMRDHPEEIAAMGERGLRCAKENFDRAALAARYEQSLRGLVASRRRPVIPE